MKMLLFSLVLAFIGIFGSEGAEVDPTTVCYPATLFAKYFNMITDDTGNVTYDFNQELYAEVSDKTGIRVVHDFKNLKAYAILQRGNTTTCKTSIIYPSAVMNQCLPAYAKHLTDASGYIGYKTFSTSSIYAGYTILADTWEVVTDYDRAYRITYRLIKSTYYPVYSQEFGYHGIKDMYMYLYPTATIPDKTVFELPGECATDEEVVFPRIFG